MMVLLSAYFTSLSPPYSSGPTMLLCSSLKIPAITNMELTVVTIEHQWIILDNNLKLDAPQPEDVVESKL